MGQNISIPGEGVRTNEGFTVLTWEFPESAGFIYTPALTAFTAALAALPSGGVHATADKNKKRRELVALLRKLASYVQGNCNDEITTLLSSGFQAASTARAQSPLTKPVIAVVDNCHSGQLVVDVKKVVNARTYELEKATIGPDGAPGPWQQGGLFTGSRDASQRSDARYHLCGSRARRRRLHQLQRLERPRQPHVHVNASQIP
ncbi:MAG: hypothetical protein DMG11_30265 [Acidobacteria bacterium]|nr:MAG: hypothetical protein DMG11_30265 [Acidobacteriota bacterium]